MQQQPAVKPAVQALLAHELARFFTNVLEILERGVRRCGDQSAQRSEGAVRTLRIREAGPVPPRLVEKRPHFSEIEAAQRSSLLVVEEENFRGGGNGGGTCARAYCCGGSQRNRARGDGTERGKAARPGGHFLG